MCRPSPSSKKEISVIIWDGGSQKSRWNHRVEALMMKSLHGSTDSRARGKPSPPWSHHCPSAHAATTEGSPKPGCGFTPLLCHSLPSGALLDVHPLQVVTTMICLLQTHGCIAGTASPRAGSCQLLCFSPFPPLQPLSAPTYPGSQSEQGSAARPQHFPEKESLLPAAKALHS